jgi:hypothetical protein
MNLIEEDPVTIAIIIPFLYSKAPLTVSYLK